MKRSNKSISSLIFVILLALGIGIGIYWYYFSSEWESLETDLSPKTTAQDLIPKNVDEYSKVETDDLIRKATASGVGLGIGASTRDLERAYAAAGISDTFIECYQDAGSVNSKGFYNTKNPIVGGVIVVADRNKLKDPELLSQCISEILPMFSVAGKKYQPCGWKYKIVTPHNEFYVLIAGTDTPACNVIKESMEL